MNTDDEGEWTVDWKLWGVGGWSRGQCGAWLSVYHCLRQQRATWYCCHLCGLVVCWPCTDELSWSLSPATQIW